MLVTVLANDTEASLTDKVCLPLASPQYTGLRIYGYRGINFPSCMFDYGGPLDTIIADTLTVSSFAAFPTGLRTLSLTVCDLPGPSILPDGAIDGFTSDREIAWEEVWQLLPNLVSLSIASSSLKGTLPQNGLLSTLTSFSLAGNDLYGGIPSNLFSNSASLPSVDLSSNPRIGGSLPNDLFVGITLPSELKLKLAGTGLIGTIPSGLFAPFENAALATFQVDLSDNTLSGPLPSALLPLNFLANSGTPDFSLNLGNNNLGDGGLPTEFLANVAYFRSFHLSLARNKLSGLIPAVLFHNGWHAAVTTGIFSLDLSYNLFDGVSAGFLTSQRQVNSTFSDFHLDLSNNQLSGGLPQELLYDRVTISQRDHANDRRNATLQRSTESDLASSADPPTKIVTILPINNLHIDLSFNMLSGALPDDLLYQLSPNVLSTYLHIGENQFSGPFPVSLFATMNGASGSNSLTLIAVKNAFGGSLPSPCWTSGFALIFRLGSNSFDGTIPTDWSNCKLEYVDVSKNGLISGSIPPGVISLPSLVYFNASTTDLEGPLPSVGSSLTTLDLDGTFIDFCSTQSSSPRGLATCSLRGTLACDCQDKYLECDMGCFNSNPFLPVEITPIPIASNPIAAPSPTPVPTSVPVPISTPTTVACPSRAPGPTFSCIDGRWTSTVDIAGEVLTIPAGAGVVVVNGNLTSSSVVINGLGSSIEIDGCAANLSQIVIELTKEQIEQLGKTKLQQLLKIASSECAANLSSVNVALKSNGGGCKKVSVSKSTSGDGKTLSGLFTMDNSSCNTWWIVLVSVICGVILLAIIVLVLMAIFWPAFRQKIRPYSKGRTAASPNV